MLVLTRKLGERIHIGEDIVLTVVEINGDSIRLGVDAPRDVTIRRAEVLNWIQDETLAATTATDADANALLGLLGGAATKDTPAGR